FVEGALVLEEHVHHELKVLIEDVDHLLGLMLLSKGCKVAYIRKEHRHLTARTAQGAQVRIRQDLRHDLWTEIATEGLAQDLGVGDVVNQHHHPLILATLVVEHLRMDRVVMDTTGRREQAVGTTGDAPQAFDLVNAVLQRNVMETSKYLLHGLADDVGSLVAAQAFHGPIDLEDAMRLFISHQQPAGYTLENALIEIVQRLK